STALGAGSTALILIKTSRCKGTEGTVRKRFLAALFFAAISIVAWGSVADGPTITQDELVRRTQELLDSVAPGNREPFKKYFADDAMFFDEKGRALDKAALVKDIQPMPKGYSG